jgi:GDP-L-fucose synthase
MMHKKDKIAVFGQEGMIVSALARRLEKDGYANRLVVTPSGTDLTNQKTVQELFLKEKPAYVFLTSVRMGGIIANSTYPAEFIYENIQAQTCIIHSAWKSGVKKLLYLASSCVYPKASPQPMQEEYLLSGALEPTSEPYAVAKIAGIKMCHAYNMQYGTKYITAIPADLYGPDDDFDPRTSHVLSSLLKKTHEAKVAGEAAVTVWGTGSPRREFFHVDDMAEACLYLMKYYDEDKTINIGFGEDVSVKELALLIKEVVGFKGEIIFDASRPDGAPRKLLNSDRIRSLGWKPEIKLRDGIQRTYHWYLQHRV